MAEYKNKWESSSTRWWVRCTKETAAMMEQLDQTSDTPEKTREESCARELWSEFAALVHDCFNNGNDRWEFQQSATAQKFRNLAAGFEGSVLALRGSKGVPKELYDFLDTATEEVRPQAPGRALEALTRTPGRVDEAPPARARLGARGGRL